MGPAVDSSSETLQFPKLNGSNYHTWADNMKSALQAKSLWGVVSGRERRPPEPPADYPKLAAASTTYASVAATSPSAASATAVPTVPSTPSGKGKGSSSVAGASKTTTAGSGTVDVFDIFQSKEYRSWELAVERYEKWLNKDDAAMGLMRNAIEYTQRESVISIDNSQSMWDHLRTNFLGQHSGINVYYHYQQLYSKKWDGTSSISDHIGFYMNIRRRFIEAGHRVDDITIVNALLLSLPRTPTWEVVKQSLLQQGQKLTLEAVTTELVMVHDRVVQEDIAEGVDKRFKTLALVSQSESSSPNRGKSGNNSGGKGGNKGGKNQASRKERARQLAKPDDVCNRCGGKGHWSPVCDKPKKTKDSAHLAVDNRSAEGREVGKVFMANHSPNIYPGLLLDCAASCHMFANRQFFMLYEPLKDEYVTVGGSHKVPVEGQGVVRFRAKLHGEQLCNITLTEVLHIPALGANLVSLGTLQRAGAELWGMDYGLGVMLNDNSAFHAKLIGLTGTLYAIQCVEIAEHVAYVTDHSTMRLWHRRMGHLSPSTIRSMQTKDLVNGLKVTAPKDFDRVCAGCAHGKSHRSPLPDSSTTQYSKMELLVMDLTGPVNIPTWDGYIYALVVVETSCRYPVGRLLKDKGEVGVAVRDIVAMLERQSGVRTRRIRTDSGTEFVNAAMDDFCQRNGIIHETTNPYRPEQNGIAERAIAVFFEMLRCMLHSAGMDLQYWGEAFMYAVHIRSLMLTSGLEGMVPHEAWTGRKPDVSHLRVFGSLGWAHVPKAVRHGKLESRAVRVRLLGWWANETKGYRLEDLENGKLITSRDVQFEEDDTPSELACIDLPKSSPEEVDRLVDDAIMVEDDGPVHAEDALTSPPPLQYPATPSPTPPVSLPDPPPAPKKSSKWENLPRREPSSRIRNQTERREENAHVAFLTINGEPDSYKEMVKSPNKDGWIEAVEKEYQQLEDMGVFEWVKTLPDGKRPVGSRVVYRDKLDGQGNHVKYKARIVARGFSQVPGEDFTETFSSVAKFTTLRVFLSLAAFLDFDIHQIDIVAAYLQGDLDEEIYMEVPKEVLHLRNEGRFWRLKKALYGLKQAGRQWKKRLHEVLTGLGFVRAFADDCLYILRRDGKIVLMILVYVDDMAVAGPNFCKIISFKNDLTNDFDITDVGELEYMLGIRVVRDRPNRKIYLDQSAYINKIITRFGMHNSHPVSTPLAVNHGLSLAQCPTDSDGHKDYSEYAKGIQYLSLVGSLLFATQTRPDIQFAVGLVAQFSSNPGIAHLAAAKRILHYLKGTANYALVLGRRDEGSIDLVGWSDASWAQDPDFRRSVSGFVFDIAGGSVSWSSKKQSVVATSSVEAEYIASANATKEAIWLRTLLNELDFPQTTATIIHADNQGCIALAGNPVSHSRAKHIDICHHFICEHIEHDEIKLQFVSTKDMLADIFTKALPRDSFVKFREHLSVLPVITTSGSVEDLRRDA